MPIGHGEVAEVRKAILPTVSGGTALAVAVLAAGAAAQGHVASLVGWVLVDAGLIASFVAVRLGFAGASAVTFLGTAVCALFGMGLVESDHQAELILPLGAAIIVVTAVGVLDRGAWKVVLAVVTEYVVAVVARWALGGSGADPVDLAMNALGGGVALLVLGQITCRNQAALVDALARGEQHRTALVRTNDDLRVARDQALAASGAKSKFLANMSHELRTPLNAIVGYAELLREEAPDEQWRKDLGAIRGAGKHLLAIIDKLLDLAKVESGQLEIRRDLVDLAEVAHQVCEQVAPLFAGRDVVLVRPEVAHLGPAWLDETRLRQVLLNLVGNAAKFTEVGNVSVSVGGDSERVWIEVVDTGPGISPGLAERLFEPFVQGRHQAGGTGLGLAIARQLVTLMGGVVDLGPAPGGGTRASVRLPRDGRDPVRPASLVTESSEPVVEAFTA